MEYYYFTLMEFVSNASLFLCLSYEEVPNDQNSYHHYSKHGNAVNDDDWVSTVRTIDCNIHNISNEESKD